MSVVSRTCAPPSFISCNTLLTEPSTFVEEAYTDDELLTYSDDDEDNESTSPDQGSFQLPQSTTHIYAPTKDLVFPELHDNFAVSHYGKAESDQKYLLQENMSFISNPELPAVNNSEYSTGLFLDPQPYHHSISISRPLPTSPNKNHNSAFVSIPNRPPRPNSPFMNTALHEQQMLLPKRKEDRKSNRKHRHYYTDMPDSNRIKELFGPSILDSDYHLSDPRGIMHDKAFAFLFLIHLLFVAFIAIRFGGIASMIASSKLSVGAFSTLSSTYNYPTPDIYVDFRNAIYIAIAAVLYSSSLTFLTIGIMVILNRSFIQSSLCFAVIFCFAWGVLGIAIKPFSFIPILGIIAVVLTIAYTVVVWDRIPLAAVNLNTSLVGLRKSMDLILFGCLMMVITVIWTIYWAFASIGLYDYIVINSKSLDGTITFTAGCLCLCMILSYFWTVNIILVRFTWMILDFYLVPPAIKCRFLS